MASIDFMKVLDTAVITLDLSSKVEFQALDLMVFKATLTNPDGKVNEITMKVNEFDLELYLKKNILGEKEFLKWINKFEFQLEQNFLKNITISHTETKTDYRIKILY
jgi:hypothetical protein